MNALLAAFSGVVGNVKSVTLRPVKRSGYRSPCPGKFPAIGVKPWMCLSFQRCDVCVSRYWA